MDPGDADREELAERVEQLEETVSKMLPDRRGVLKGLGAAAVGGAAVGASSGGASGQSAAGQVGTEGAPVDVEAAQGNFDSVSANEMYTVEPEGGIQAVADALADHGQVNLKAGETYTGTTEAVIDAPDKIVDLRGATIDYTGADAAFRVQASNLGSPTYRQTPRILGGNIMLGDNALAGIRVTNTYATRILYPHIEAKTAGAPTAGILLRDEDDGFSEETEVHGATIRGPNACIQADAPNATENKSGKATKIVGGHWEIPDSASYGISLLQQEGMYDSVIRDIGVNNGQDTDMIYLDGGAAKTTRFINIHGEAQGDTGAYCVNLGSNSGPNLPSFHYVDMGGSAGWLRNNPNDLNFLREGKQGDDGHIIYNQRDGETAELQQRVLPGGKAAVEYTGSVYEVRNNGNTSGGGDGPRWFMPSRGRFNPNGSEPTGDNKAGDVALASSNWDPDGDGNGELVIFDGSGWVEITDLPNL